MPTAPPKPSTNGRVLKAALDYVDRGIPIVPCGEKSKKPIGKEWQHKRLTRDELIAELEGTHRNIAIVLRALTKP